MLNSQYIKAVVNLLFYIGVFVGLILIVPRVWVYFIPFIIAWLLAFCASPVVLFLEKRIKIKRKFGSIFVIILVIGVLATLFYLLLATLWNQIGGWILEMPNLAKSITQIISTIQSPFIDSEFFSLGKTSDILATVSEELIQLVSDFANTISTNTLTVVKNVTRSVPMILLGTIVTLFFSYILVAEKTEQEQFFNKHFPKVVVEKYAFMKQIIQEAIGGYLKAQLKIIVWIILVLVIGLLLLQVRYALVIALIIGFLDFLPILGAGLIMIPWSIFGFLSKDYKLGIGILILWGATQLLRQLIQPKYVGESIGLKPVPTLLLLYFGFSIAGMTGLILSMPIGYILMSLYKVGAFDTGIKSMIILINGFNEFRKLK